MEGAVGNNEKLASFKNRHHSWSNFACFYETFAVPYFFDDTFPGLNNFFNDNLTLMLKPVSLENSCYCLKLLLQNGEHAAQNKIKDLHPGGVLQITPTYIFSSFLLENLIGLQSYTLSHRLNNPTLRFEQEFMLRFASRFTQSPPLSFI